MNGQEKPVKRSSTDGDGASNSEATGTGGAGDLFSREQSAVRLGFVVQFTDPHGPQAFSGRVQHLLTSDGGNFSSSDALIAILRRVLERTQARERSDE